MEDNKMSPKWLFFLIFTTLFFLSLCDNTISNDDNDIYTKSDFIGTWSYSDTCLLWELITYNLTDSICTKKIVYIDSLEYKRISDDTIIFENWYVQKDSLFLLFDTTTLYLLFNI